MRYSGSIIWMLVSVAGVIFAAVHVFEKPEVLLELVDLLASIISILAGVSLAVIAVLASPFSVRTNSDISPDEATRIDRVVSADDDVLTSGQVVIFFLYLVTLAFLILFKWVYHDNVFPNDEKVVKYLASAAGGLAVFSFLWSARLPVVLAKVARQRKSLGQ